MSKVLKRDALRLLDSPNTQRYTHSNTCLSKYSSRKIWLILQQEIIPLRKMVLFVDISSTLLSSSTLTVQKKEKNVLATR